MPLVQIKGIGGYLTLEQKQEMIRKVTDAVVSIEGEGLRPVTWVTIEDEEGEERCYRIVGPDEFGMAEEYISMDSPVAKALLGKNLDDEVSLDLPSGKTTLIIIDIEYKK